MGARKEIHGLGWFGRLDFLIFLILTIVLIGMSGLNLNFALSGLMTLTGLGFLYLLIRTLIKRRFKSSIYIVSLSLILTILFIGMGVGTYPEGVLQSFVGDTKDMQESLGSGVDQEWTITGNQIKKAEMQDIGCGSKSECRDMIDWLTDSQFNTFWKGVSCKGGACYAPTIEIKGGVKSVKE